MKQVYLRYKNRLKLRELDEGKRKSTPCMYPVFCRFQILLNFEKIRKAVKMEKFYCLGTLNKLKIEKKIMFIV